MTATQPGENTPKIKTTAALQIVFGWTKLMGANKKKGRLKSGIDGPYGA